MDINQIIRAEREKRRYSQVDMARMLKISPSAYLQIEKGKTELTLSRLTQIASVLDVSISYLLKESGIIESGESESAKALEAEVSLLRKYLEVSSNVADQFFADSIEKVALDLNLGRWELTELATGKMTVFEGGNLLNMQKPHNYKKIQKGLENGTHKLSVSVTDEEDRLIRTEVIKNDSGVLYILDNLGFVRDKEFSEQIKEDGKRFNIRNY